MSVLMFLFSPQADYYSAAYAGRSALSYDPVQQGIVGYPYTGRDYYGRPYFDSPDAVMGRGILQQMQRRCPFIPSDLIDEKVSNFFFCILFIYFLFTGIVQTTYRSKHTNITKFTTTTLITKKKKKKIE